MNYKMFYNSINLLISSVWLVNGLYCKVLNLVPRHQMIVERIITNKFSQEITILIGFSEIFMAIWILSRLKSRWSSVMQIAVVGIMNVLEFILVPDLLLWGRFNSVFAGLFILTVYTNEFIIKDRVSPG